MNIIFSFNKFGPEGKYWEQEIRGASYGDLQVHPFNHGNYLDPVYYDDSVKLERLYQGRNPQLLQMYQELERMIEQHNADVLFVTNCPPYHPEFLRTLSLYKVLYSTDDPGATYMRTIPYLHAYEHVMFCAPGYSPDLSLEEKMRYCGMINADWLPIGAMDFEFDSNKTEQTILSHERDIKAIYIGKFWRQKADLLFKTKQALRRELQIYGLFEPKHNLYVNARYGGVGWIRPVSFKERVILYQGSKIGINIHWNQYGLGNQRLYHLPANGVMQICDCGSLASSVFREGEEIVTYDSADDLIDKVRYYLEHDDERNDIALRAYRRTMREYRFKAVARKAARLIEEGMKRVSGKWQRGRVVSGLSSTGRFAGSSSKVETYLVR